MMKTNILFILVLTIFLMLSCKNKELDEKLLFDEFTISKFNHNIKVKSYYDYTPLVRGGTYKFYFKKENEKEWKEINTFNFDDPILLDKKNINFINEKLGYFYYFKYYVITKNNGLTWEKYYKIKSKNFNNNCYKINNLNINLDGSGLIEIETCETKKLILKTTDFGKTWF